MLLFGRGKVFRLIEEGLVWKAGEPAQFPGWGNRKPEGVFVEVPAFANGSQLENYISALAIESGHALKDARPSWVQLRGAGLQTMPYERIRDVVRAACPGASALGMELNPRLLGPGDIAGYRAIGVERFCFRMESPYDRVDDPARRARALGAFASIEVCFSDELNALTFMHAVGRALEAAPGQVSISDERRNPSANSEQMESVSERILKAGYKRQSMWSWTKTDTVFDRLGLQLSGRGAGIGPGAFTCRPYAFRAPAQERWVETRQTRSYEVVCAEGGLEQWLALAYGLYALELRHQSMDFKAHRQATALARMGIIDRNGKPVAGRPMEFCHKVARLAQLAVMGDVNPAQPMRPARGPRAADTGG